MPQITQSNLDSIFAELDEDGRLRLVLAPKGMS